MNSRSISFDRDNFDKKNKNDKLGYYSYMKKMDFMDIT